MPNLPDATIIILNWNGKAYLEACLTALLDQTYKPQEILLVDNASTDDSPALVRESFPAVKIIENERNLGYAAGNNAALRQVDSETAVLVNPDIVAGSDWLENLLAPFAADKTIGIVGSKLLYPGKEQQLQHAGGLITHPQAMPAHRGMYESDEGQFDEPADVDFVTGAAIAVRRDVLETAGLLDEGFFMYFEDADWCARARRSGFRVVYAPRATAVHDESATSVRGSASYLRRFHSGRWRYLLKHFAPAEIINGTLPAETAWLGGIEGAERRALGWAYRDSIGDFPAIMAARTQDGAKAITQADQDLIIGGLLDLRRAALLWPDKPAQWQDLMDAGQVKPRPFTSTVPAAGPLIARLRDLWASAAAKPYTGALNAQQNEFNLAAAQELQGIENRLRAFADVWMRQEEERRELTWEIAAIQQELDKAYRSLSRIESRIRNLEEQDGEYDSS
ncbi:MAG: glycosyltransferase [Candidatus Promineifilaceae bacterium]